MMRSSSMLVTRARSVRNICKVPFKFRFDLIPDNVDRVAGSGDVVLVWARSSNPLSTAPARLDTTNRRTSFTRSPLSAEVTLFKTAATDRRFHDKVIKLALRADSIEGKTIAKLHLNLAEYAEVPSACRRISAEMDGGPTLLATVQCTFLSTGKAASSLRGPAPVSRESSLALSSDEEASECASEFGNVAAESQAGKLKGKLRVRRSGSRSGLEKGKDKDGADGSDGAEELERALKQNVKLRAQVEGMEKARGGKAFEENRALRRKLSDLKLAVAREPVYSDIVKELKQTKMALAMVMLDKDKLAAELVKFQ